MIKWTFLCFLPLFNWICVCLAFVSLCLFEDQFNWESVSLLSPFSSAFSSLFLTIYIYIFQLFRWALPMFLYSSIFSSFVFLPVLIWLCVFHLFEDQFKVEKRWRKGGEKVEKWWRASPSCLTFPPPDTFPHPRGFPTPANSGKTKDFWEIFFIGLLFVFRSFAR